MKLDSTKVAIVTGGASGLGEATVRLLASHGCKVMIADLNEQRGQEIATELKCAFFKTDVSNEDNIKALMAETVAKFGAIHILVNSAGVLHAGLMINSKGNTIASKDMTRVLNINVLGTFNMTKYAAL